MRLRTPCRLSQLVRAEPSDEPRRSGFRAHALRMSFPELHWSEHWNLGAASASGLVLVVEEERGVESWLHRPPAP